ncbi:Cell division protein ftsY [Bacillus cereus Rock3-44]|nr:Cell division protein ftsY [Bacillus cereus Rock3-44]
MELIDQLKEEVQRRNIQDPKEVQAVISEKLVGIQTLSVPTMLARQLPF